MPCLTLRENTERSVTITEGTNKLVGTDKGKIIDEALKSQKMGSKKLCAGTVGWDGGCQNNKHTN
ncbi:MAG: hypothetical protein RDU59_04110 [Thermodesulfobacteriota bacterium]|nr:hypothetical protein [Thermodesulfobacteriota bacterium]